MVAAAMLATACLPRGRFHCDDDRQCTSADTNARGFCEAGGVCSFSDASCPLGRRFPRYTDEAGTQAGRCVDARACASTPVVEIAAGGDHACLRRLDGRVFCWGRNHRGQLGDGSTSHRSVPVAVAGLDAPVRALALGAAFSCAIDRELRVACWGEGAGGALGAPATFAPAPVLVPGVASALELAPGRDFACARIGDGVTCWGANQRFQLGRGEASVSGAPAAVALPAPADQIVAGSAHACARLRDGARPS